MKKVGFIVDWENNRIPINSNPNLRKIKDFVESNYGNIIFSRVYIPDLPRNEELAVKIERLGLTTKRYPKIKCYGHNGTDCDGFLIHDLAVLPYKFPHIDTVVVMCGDGHILHSIRSLREMGKKIVLISTKNTVNHVLKQSCDEYHDYFQITSKNHVKTTIETESSKSEQRSETSKVKSSDAKAQSSETNENWAQNLFSGKGEFQLYKNSELKKNVEEVKEES